jgi:transcriptional regulator with XRE-family HTH domain
MTRKTSADPHRSERRGAQRRSPGSPNVAVANRKGDGAQWIGTEIRALRKTRRVSLEQLAQRTGKSVGYLSQVERGLSHPTIDVLKAISSGLGVHIGWFFPNGTPADPSDRGVVVREAARRRLSFGGGITDFLLSPNLGGALEFMFCEFEPGATSGRDTITHEGEEAGLVLCGTLELWVGKDHFILEAGDSFTYQSGRPHRYANSGSCITRVVWVVTPPSY